jgi:flagellar motor switch protein FliN/FliY
LRKKIVNLITKEENADFDEMALNCISEVVAMHSGTEIQELDKTGKFLGLASNPPEAANSPKAMLRIPQNKFPLISYPISLDGQTYTLWECLGGEVGEQISNAYGGNDTAELESVPASDNVASSAGMNQMNQMGGMQPQMNLGMNQMGMQSQMGMNMNQMAMQPQMNMGMNQMAMNPMGMQQMPMGQNMGMNMPNVQTLQYPNLQGSNVPGEQGNISLIMDVYMEMTVELGRTKKQIKEILGMGEGTIIELDKLAGEPVDILVNHKPIAKGEVVVIDESFGVRVTEILSPLERVSDLH